MNGGKDKWIIDGILNDVAVTEHTGQKDREDVGEDHLIRIDVIVTQMSAQKLCCFT